MDRRAWQATVHRVSQSRSKPDIGHIHFRSGSGFWLVYSQSEPVPMVKYDGVKNVGSFGHKSRRGPG